jgi:hypothetical protein
MARFINSVGEIGWWKNKRETKKLTIEMQDGMDCNQLHLFMGTIKKQMELSEISKTKVGSTKYCNTEMMTRLLSLLVRWEYANHLKSWRQQNLNVQPMVLLITWIYLLKTNVEKKKTIQEEEKQVLFWLISET